MAFQSILIVAIGKKIVFNIKMEGTRQGRDRVMMIIAIIMMPMYKTTLGF